MAVGVGNGVGIASGPDWFCNLRAADSADVRVGAERTQMRMRELTGAERSTIWTDVILREDPGVGRFATKARRTIPVAVLEPLEE
jgi:hypothetical protein